MLCGVAMHAVTGVAKPSDSARQVTDMPGGWL